VINYFRMLGYGIRRTSLELGHIIRPYIGCGSDIETNATL
jgi:hypothetical protein